MIKILFTLMLIFFINLSYARPGVPFYHGVTEVSSHNEVEKNGAMEKAMREVLVKVSGDSKIANLPAIKEAIQHAAIYADAFRYYQTDTINEFGQKRRKLNIDVHFNEHEISELLTKNKQFLWQKKRPVTLVWLAEETMTGPSLINTESRSAALEYFRSQSNYRGLPVTLPSLDLQALHILDPLSVWFQDLVAVKRASTYYHADAILLGSLAVDKKDHWHALWLAEVEGKTVRWETIGDSEQQVISKGVNDYTDALAEQAMIKMGEDQRKQREANTNDMGEDSIPLALKSEKLPLNEVEPPKKSDE